jgi:hypothetical protein
MRRFDKIKNIRKANLLLERRFLHEKQYGDSDGDYEYDKECETRSTELYDRGLESYRNGDLESAEKYRQEALKIGSWLSWGDTELPPYDEFENTSIKENLINEEQFGDLFKFLEQDPKKMSQGSVYYVSDMNSSMNKSIVDENGNKVPNPMYGKLFKHTRFLFKWENTFGKAMEKIDPDYIVNSRSGSYEKLQGYNMLETGKSGLYLPIIPTGSEYQYVINDNGQMKQIDKESVKKYLRPQPPMMDNKAQFRALIVDKIVKITGGGNVWINPNFTGEYMGIGNI